jgi:hypothetical protein
MACAAAAGSRRFQSASVEFVEGIGNRDKGQGIRKT